MKSLSVVVLCVVSCSGDHSGAYSSPQYAKKMFPSYDPTGNGLLPDEKPIPYKGTHRMYYESPEETHRSFSERPEVLPSDAGDGRNGSSPSGRSSLLEAASGFWNGRGGQVVSDIAKEFVSRSTAGSSQVRFECLSQVLSLNLSNLVILVVLKALIVAAGFFGAGAWGGAGAHGHGRSLHDNTNAEYLSEEEIQLYLGYLRAHRSGDYGCLQLACCRRPQQAALYSSGADLLLRAGRLMRGDGIDLNKMEAIAAAAREAVTAGEGGASCHQRYQCTGLV